MINRIIERMEELRPERECFDNETDFYYAEDQHNKYVEIIKEESKNNGWIPVSEKLPNPQEDGDKDFSDDVQICMSNDIVTDAWYCFSDEKWYKQGNGILIGKVIAWMSLPEPYKGE